MRRPHHHPHLENRIGGWYWRRRWPRLLDRDQNATGRPDRFLGFVLRTNLPAEARDLASHLTRMSDQVFLAPRDRTMTISRADAERILIEMIRFEIAAFEQARAVAPVRSRELALADAARQEAELATLREAFWLRDRDAVCAPLRRTAEHLGLALDETDPDWAGLAFEATRAMIETWEERIRRDRGHFTEPMPVFRRALRDAPTGHCLSSPAPACVSPLPAAAPDFASSRREAPCIGATGQVEAAPPPILEVAVTPPIGIPAPPAAIVAAVAVAGPMPVSSGAAMASCASVEPSVVPAPVALLRPPPTAPGCRTRPLPYPEGQSAEDCVPGPFNAGPGPASTAGGSTSTLPGSRHATRTPFSATIR